MKVLSAWIGQADINSAKGEKPWGDNIGEDDLGPVADAGDDGLDLQGRQILSLIDHHELVCDAATADVTERFDHNHPRTHKVGGTPMLVAHIQVTQHLERVMNGLHPGIQLFIQ